MNYIIYGEETHQVKKQIQAVIKKEMKEVDQNSFTIYDAQKSTLDEILEDAQTIPFFDDKKCIIVQNANFLSTIKDVNYDLEQLLIYMQNPMESTILIWSGNFAKLDTRKKAVKQLSSLCQCIVCNKLDKTSKLSYLKEAIKKRDLQIDVSLLTLLNERLPYDAGMIQNELDKLELYGEALNQEVIMHLVSCSLEDDVFRIVHAVVDKDIKQCFKIWRDLQIQNYEPVHLIALITSQFHLLYQVKILQKKHGLHQDEIAKRLKIHPYRVKLALPICRRMRISSMLKILNELATCDQNIKSGKMDKTLGFELFLLKMKG